MVFSSIPAYQLDPPNWQQNPNFYTGNNDLLPPPQQPPLPPPPSLHHGVGGAGSIRPGSMVDQARMANIPMPETALKCPRCESTHTKFCYFNNYSLSQPRHFCKTCRRYWTRGGALRSVPVGGGCRRNKRSNSKGSSSSNPKSEPANSGSSNSTLPSYTNAATPTTSNIILGGLASQIPQLRFVPPLTHLMADYGQGRERGVNHGGISGGPIVSTTSEMNFQIGSKPIRGSRDALWGGSGGGNLEQWRMHQAPQFIPNFLSGFDPSILSQGGVLYGHSNNQDGGFEASKLSSSCSMMSQLASVKMEGKNSTTTKNNNNRDDHQLSNSASQFARTVQLGNEHQWSTTAWTDLTGFTTSSTSNPL